MNPTPPIRRPARAELAAVTEARVLEGLGALFAKGEEFSYERLSAESGVPQRTLYRYFPNREALFSAFWPWVDQRIGVPARLETPEDVVAHVPELYAAFDRNEALVRTMQHHPHGRAVRLEQAEARREKFRLALWSLLDGLALEEGIGLLASVTVICSASGWESMRDDWGLSGPAAAHAAQWAVQALVDGARGRSGSLAD